MLDAVATLEQETVWPVGTVNSEGAAVLLDDTSKSIWRKSVESTREASVKAKFRLVISPVSLLSRLSVETVVAEAVSCGVTATLAEN